MEDASKISGGDMTVDTNSTFRSESNAVLVNDLNNAGLVDSINGGYENHITDVDGNRSGTMTIGDNNGDNQGDFTIDIYGRSDSKYNNDSFGSDTIYTRK